MCVLGGGGTYSINTIIMAGADSLVLRFSLTKRKRDPGNIGSA